MELILALCVWALKEAYQSFIGSRAKTLESLEQAKLKLIRLETIIETQNDKLDKLSGEVLRLSEKRAYRN